MKQTPNQLFKQLSKKFSPKKDKELINEELGQIVTLKPINSIEASAKDPFWTKFENFLAEGGTLDPIVNGDMKTNTLEKEEKIKINPKLKYEMDNKLAGSYKISDGVENIGSHNYDYDPKVENINNINGEELLKGVQLETKYNQELTLDEAKELAIKNLTKDPLHYVKEGQFGVKGLGYTEAKTQKADGKHAYSGYSEKLKDGSTEMQVVKESINESFGQVVTSGNPNSLAAQSGELIRQMMAEKEEEKKLPMDESPKPDFADIDGDGDKEETIKKAAKDKKKKMKKENIDSKLAEIGKEAEKVKMEAQLDFLHDHISEKVNRVNSIQEDENLSELIDKSKMKQMQREIKDLERRKAKMERIYEKSCGSKYSKKEIVDEMDEVSWNDKNNPSRGAAGERDPKKVGQSVSAYAINEGLDGGIYEIPKDAPDSALKPYIGKFLKPTGAINDMVSNATEYDKEGGLFKVGQEIKLDPPVSLSSFGKSLGKPEKAKDDNEKPAEYRDESGKKIKNKDFDINKVSYKLVK